MRIELEVKMGFKDVLIRPKRSTLNSRSEVELERQYVFKHSKKHWEGIPIVASNMSAVGTFQMAEALSSHNMITSIHKHYSFEEWETFLKNKEQSFFNHFTITAGLKESDYKFIKKVIERYPQIQFICADVANGYTERFSHFISQLRESFPTQTIIAGNVVTGEMTEELILSGADIVKIGIGSGSVCTTRTKTGVGYPQLSAIIECADAAHGLGGLAMSDGGCVVSGDVAKAFAAGSDFVMLGGMLAAHDESHGNIVEIDGVKKMEFFGMSSEHAMDIYEGGTASYRASEGKLVYLDTKGPVKETVQDILGGLRSSCTYVGAASLKELSKRTTFIKVQEQANEIFTAKSS